MRSATTCAPTSPICPNLIGNGAEVRQYASAIAEQNLELRKVRNDLRRFGCSVDSMVVIGGENAHYCSELPQAEARMVENIRYLQDRRIELRDQGSAGYHVRRELMAALEDKGCNALEEISRPVARLMSGAEPRRTGNA